MIHDLFLNLGEGWKEIYPRIMMRRRDALAENQDYFKGYIKGYEDGLLEAWEELISLTTKGYTSREIQVLAKNKRSTLAQRIKDKVEDIHENTGIDLIDEMLEERGAATIAAPGFVYLVKENGLQRTIAIYNSLVKQGAMGMCITRSFPGDVRGSLLGEPQMVWLTKQENISQEESGFNPEDCISPSDMGKILTTSRNFTRGGKGSIVLLEGIEYLVIQNDFQGVMKFLYSLVDQAKTTRSIVLLPVCPTSLEARDFKILESNIKYRL